MSPLQRGKLGRHARFLTEDRDVVKTVRMLARSTWPGRKTRFRLRHVHPTLELRSPDVEPR